MPVYRLVSQVAEAAAEECGVKWPFDVQAACHGRCQGETCRLDCDDDSCPYSRTVRTTPSLSTGRASRSPLGKLAQRGQELLNVGKSCSTWARVAQLVASRDKLWATCIRLGAEPDRTRPISFAVAFRVSTGV